MPTRRVIRTIEPAAGAGFDEQLWPINLALLVLCGIVAGFIFATGDFQSPDLLTNGWFYLATLVTGVCLLVWGASWVGGRRGRRFQLAAMVSLAVHLALALGMAKLYLEAVAIAGDDRPRPPLEPIPVVTVPDYPIHRDETNPLPQDFERPVEAGQLEESPREIERTPPEPHEPTPSPQPAPIPETVTEIEPGPVTREEPSPAVPRRSDEDSRLSRQTAEMSVAATPAALAPQSEAPTTPEPPALTPDDSRLARQAAAAVTPSAAAEPVASELTASNRPVEPSAAATESPSPDVPIPALARAQSAAAPNASEPAAPALPSPEQAAELPRSALDAANSELARAAAAAPAAAPTPAAEDPIASASQTATAARAADARPSTADAESSLARASATPAASDVAADAALLPATTVEPESEPAPTPQGAAAARSAAAALPSDSAAASTAQASEAPLAASASAAPARAATADAAGPDGNRTAATLGPGGREAAAVPAADNLAGPELGSTAEGPSFEPSSTAGLQAADAAAARSAPTTAPQANPSLASDGGRDGGALAQAAPSASRAAPTSDLSSPTVSASGRGASGRPASPSALPASSLEALDVPIGDIAGANQPQGLDASGGAAVARAPASAPAASGASTGAAGEPGSSPAAAPTAGRAATPSAGRIQVAGSAAGLPRSGAGGGDRSAAAAPAPVAAPAASTGTTSGESAGGGPIAARPGGAQRSAPASVSAGSLPASNAPSGGIAAAAPAAGRAAPRGAGPAVAAPARRARAARGTPGVVGATGVESPDLPEAAPIAGGPTGRPIDVGGTGLARREQAQATTGTARPGGDAAGEAPRAATPGLAAAATRSPTAGAAPAAVAAGGGALPKTNTAELPTGGGVADLPEIRERAGTGGAPGANGALADAAGELGRQPGSLPVQVAAAAGPGGLGPVVTANVGSLSRKAQRDADLVHPGEARFLDRRAAGALAVDGRAREPSEAFGRRGRDQREGGGAGRLSAKSEEAIEQGLEFLARKQSADGRWSLHDFPGAIQPRGAADRDYDAGSLRSDTAATGLALLAFLGAGYDHLDDKHQRVVQAGLEFLLANQRDNGDLFVPQDDQSNQSVWFYSHGIATIALCEALGMTGDDRLREPAQKAIDFIVQTQHARYGGWRYTANPNEPYGSDTSVTGWQVMALKSGELAGLAVPSDTFQRVTGWLTVAQASPSDESRYVYNPYAPDTVRRPDGRLVSQAAGRKSNETMTSAGLLMRMYMGWTRSHPGLAGGGDYLQRNLPEFGDARTPKRDTYYWYYATQVMFHMQGDYWKAWNERLYPMLVNTQLKSGALAGSWDPNGAVPDRWGPQGGRIYVTTLNLLSLEVYYRHLPIYESSAK